MCVNSIKQWSSNTFCIVLTFVIQKYTNNSNNLAMFNNTLFNINETSKYITYMHMFLMFMASMTCYSPTC